MRLAAGIEADHHRRRRRRACPRRASSPPIASTKPRATASPSPTPAAVGAVAEALERLEDVLALRRRDAGPAVDDAQVDPLVDDARLDAHRALAGGDHASAFSTMLATARSSSAASARRAAASRGRRRSTRVGLARGPPAPPGTTSSSPTSRIDELHRAGLQPAHVEQVADEVVEPVGPLVDRLEELAGRAGREVDVALQQAAHRRLDRRQRRAQVVRHRREQRGAQLVRLRQPGGPRRRRRAARAAGPRSPTWPANALEHVEVVVAEVAAPQDQHVVAVRAGPPTSASSGRSGATSPALRHAPAQSSPPALAEHGDAVGRERDAQLRDQLRQRVRRRRQRAAQRGERLRLGARLRAPRRCAATRSTTSRLTTPATSRKTTSASRFSPSRDRERVEAAA